MATWTSDVEVVKDLDALAQFSAGCDYIKEIPIVPYSSYGRGIPIEDKKASRPPSPQINMVEDDYQMPQSFQSGVGRGERILALSQNRQDSSLQQQLRMAMGLGYSNELIEDYFRFESSSDHSNKTGQFGDADTCSSICETTQDQSLPEGISSSKALSSLSDRATEPSSYSSSVTAGTVNVDNNDTVTFTRTQDTKSKKSVRRNRNALLNSLPNYGAGAAVESDNANEMKTRGPVRDYDSSYDHTNAISDHFKHGSTVAWPYQIGRISAGDIKERVKNGHSDFKFREDEFPPL